MTAKVLMLLLAGHAVQAHAQSREPIRVKEASFFYDVAAAAGSDREFAVSAVYPDDAGRRQWSITRVDPFGRLQEISTDALSNELGAPPRVSAILAAAGEIVIAGEFKRVGHALIKMAHDGRLIWQSSLQSPGEPMVVRNLIAGRNNEILILGRTRNAALLALYGSDGVRRWQRVYGESSWGFRDGVAGRDGSWLLVASPHDDLARGAPEVWILRVDARGEIVASGPRLPGRLGRIAAAGEMIALLYDRSAGQDRNFALASFTSDLRREKESDIATKVASFARYAISGMENGLVIAGPADSFIRILKVDRGHVVRQSYRSGPSEGLLAAGDVWLAPDAQEIRVLARTGREARGGISESITVLRFQDEGK